MTDPLTVTITLTPQQVETLAVRVADILRADTPP